ncbi:LLM class flavin-dependent oxidoreductase [Pseudonocardia petroleophila]|uniref:LLM class flavin-dependent oxidoreductase n=1 Tax=Pseudonocardia petroleophila TaxID=37331 RepID=A0A7G7MH36_9PSEU|nr:LLM class flavin-dependent oxidoreductase [Pseudonocardia petroleophila]QNG52097.1 LLM class flavin-dependent oxidoreductase [Pseudonocardia petroleophila]
MSNLRFGTFLAPIHSAGEHPTVALQRDLELVERLDRLNYDEVWIGEHHSAGSEIIGHPEIFIAAAAERTKRIRFGTGVTSVPYHNPLWSAERMVLLDHLTRGRIMMGAGPGSLPTDGAMLGLTPTDTRELLGVNLDIIVRLLAGETVTEKTLTHNLVDARLHYLPFTQPCFPISVAAVASPSGPRLAGRYGFGLMSIGATLTTDGFDALAFHWDVVEERAAHYGRPAPSRDEWRLVGAMHIAETREQAIRDVEYGIVEWFRYFQKVAAFPQFQLDGSDVEEMVAFINNGGFGVIGTPDDAAAQVERLVKQSGGFGAFLLQAHDWANPAATVRSYELLAQQVFPRFQGGATSFTDRSLEAKQRATDTRDEHFTTHAAGIAHMTEKYANEVRGG